MEFINKKLNELRLLMTLKTRNSPSSVVLKLDSLNDEEDVISLPSCSKSDEEHSNGSINSTENSISSLVGKQVFIKRSTEFRYQDAVRSASYSKSEFVLHSLQWHNILRSHHAMPPLMLSLDLCQKAQFWANHLSHTDSFYHKNDSEIGQNLLSKWTYYSEFDPSGHFTQLIWKNSKYFGIGKARTRNGKMIVVANYLPKASGNFKENVFPPIFSDTDIDRRTAIKCKLIRKTHKHKQSHCKRMSPISTISDTRLD